MPLHFSTVSDVKEAKKKFKEKESELWSDLSSTITPPVFEQIKALHSAEYQTALENVDVVVLLQIIKTVCQNALKSNASNLRKHKLISRRTGGLMDLLEL